MTPTIVNRCCSTSTRRPSTSGDAAVAALPEPAADDRDGLRAVDIVFSAQGAAEHRLDAKHFEEAPGHEGAAHVARIPVLDEQPAAGTVGVQARNRLEQPAVARHGVDLAIAEWMMRVTGRRQVFPREDEAILRTHRQRSQQDASHQREHRRRRGDRDGQDQDGRDARDPVAPQTPGGMVKVGDEAVDAHEGERDRRAPYRIRDSTSKRRKFE